MNRIIYELWGTHAKHDMSFVLVHKFKFEFCCWNGFRLFCHLTSPYRSGRCFIPWNSFQFRHITMLAFKCNSRWQQSIAGATDSVEKKNTSIWTSSALVRVQQRQSDDESQKNCKQQQQWQSKKWTWRMERNAVQTRKLIQHWMAEIRSVEAALPHIRTFTHSTCTIRTGILIPNLLTISYCLRQTEKKMHEIKQPKEGNIWFVHRTNNITLAQSTLCTSIISLSLSLCVSFLGECSFFCGSCCSWLLSLLPLPLLLLLPIYCFVWFYVTYAVRTWACFEL